MQKRRQTVLNNQPLNRLAIRHVPVMCITLATHLPYLLLPTETKALSRVLHMQKTQQTVVHTHTNLRVSSFCVGHARREFETQPPWPKLGTNGPNFGHPDISVTNSPILTFDGSNESQ